ncbi:MAG: alpha-L-fucosidase [Chitinophagaceae bacterium]|nr:alpha-L-fucosidase [Chitinophagaceae bacterium]
MRLVILAAFTCFLHTACSQRQAPPPAPLMPVPSEAQLAWHDMELNAFIHFTTNTFTGKEWGYGDEKPSVFNPSSLDANQWVSTLKDAGFKMVILTCKHHDGFCIWPSKYTEHSVKNSPYKGDVVKEVRDACNKYGLKFGVYLSPWDRNHAEYGREAYLDYYRNQLRELFTNYGPVTEMWFDGANGGDGYYGGAREMRRIDGRTYYNWPVTMGIVKEMAPDVIFFSDAGPGVRWVGNERGIAGETNWNTITADTLYAGKAGIEKLLSTGSPDGKNWVPAEVDVSIRPGWFYHENEDSLVKSPEKLFDIYLTSVGRGSLLLLNVPPDKRGLFNENDVRSLKGFREILDREFARNLATGTDASSSSHRGNADQFSAAKVTDGNKESYWATDDNVTKGSIELKLEKTSPVKYVVLQEYIRLGQRVSEFNVEIAENGQWKKIAEGTTIGHKRILKVENASGDRIRLNIISSRACPTISNIEVY